MNPIKPIVGRALVAGIIGGVLVDAFLLLTQMAPLPGVYQFVASGLVGKVAFTSAGYIWLGLVLHFVISVIWALLYAYVATVAGFARRWIVGGTVFGIVVMIGMRIVTALTHLSPSGAPDLPTLALNAVAHIFFFGWPVAWYIARTTRDAPLPMDLAV